MNGPAAFVARHPALALGLLAGAIGAGLIAPVILGLAPPAFGQLAALSASTAGFLLAAIEGGRPAVRELLGRGGRWRVGLGWWLLVVLGPIGPAVGGLYLTSALAGGAVDWSRLGSLGSAVGALVFLTVFAGLGEEFGWRGFALPRLQRRHSALAASLIVGGFHSLWHLPLFFVEGETYRALAAEIGFLPAFLGYSVLVVSLAVQSSWIFNGTGGSVLLVAVYHGALNAWNGYLDIHRGRTIGLICYVGVMAVVSVLIVVRYGPGTLTRGRFTARDPAPPGVSGTR